MTVSRPLSSNCHNPVIRCEPASVMLIAQHLPPGYAMKLKTLVAVVTAVVASSGGGRRDRRTEVAASARLWLAFVGTVRAHFRRQCRRVRQRVDQADAPLAQGATLPGQQCVQVGCDPAGDGLVDGLLVLVGDLVGDGRVARVPPADAGGALRGRHAYRGNSGAGLAAAHRPGLPHPVPGRLIRAGRADVAVAETAGGQHRAMPGSA